MARFSNRLVRRLAIGAALAVPVVMVAAPATAFHRWNDYHWKRTTAQLEVPVFTNVNATWQPYVNKAVVDWNESTMIQSPRSQGSINPKTCKAVTGTIQVCNASYGRNGWLGIATISLSGGHITRGTTKLNDTYFNTSQYNNSSWRALVACQEIGHDYGLGHQDEDFSTDGTNSCMDYTSVPGGNETPDNHDYEELLTIYNHLESATTTAGQGASGLNLESGDSPSEWGRAIHFTRDGRPDVFERQDGPGQRTITHVFWALGEGPQGKHQHHDD
jgi:hypothetical protein